MPATPRLRVGETFAEAIAALRNRISDLKGQIATGEQCAMALAGLGQEVLHVGATKRHWFGHRKASTGPMPTGSRSWT